GKGCDEGDAGGRGDDEFLLAGDELALEEGLDRGGARRRGAQAAVLHRLAQRFVGEVAAGGLHRAEQRRLGVARRRARLLRDRLERAVEGVALAERRERLRGLVAVVVVVVGAGRGVIVAAPGGVAALRGTGAGAAGPALLLRGLVPEAGDLLP